MRSSKAKQTTFGIEVDSKTTIYFCLIVLMVSEGKDRKDNKPFRGCPILSVRKTPSC
jgi:hypothetical protein